MKKIILMLFVAFLAAPVRAENAPFQLVDQALGSEKAPLTIIEYASFTCSHCGDFYRDVMPALDKKYIETGKVRFIYRDFPLNGIDLKASALAHCMPKDQFYAFVKTLFANAKAWTSSPKPEDVLTQYAALGGLEPEKAQACLKDSKIMDALVARREAAIKEYGIEFTPTFILNNGEDKIVGVLSEKEFSAKLDKILATK